MDSDTLKKRYTGSPVSEYEKVRKDSIDWSNEQRIVENLLFDIVNEDIRSILEVPVGTGRFFGIYDNLSMNVLGIDASEDMMNQAKKKLTNESNIKLRKGDILNLDVSNFNPDIVICIRLLNWFDIKNMEKALFNLNKVNPKYIIIGAYTNTVSQKIQRGYVDYVVNWFLKVISNGETTKTINERKLYSIIENLGLEVNKKELVGANFLRRYYIYLLTQKT